jgi:hypothetical protein
MMPHAENPEDKKGGPREEMISDRRLSKLVDEIDSHSKTLHPRHSLDWFLSQGLQIDMKIFLCYVETN